MASRTSESMDNDAELFSIVLTVEALEKAYVRDAVDAEAYTSACRRLIEQFKTLEHMLPECNVRIFCERYELRCPAAYHRLVEIGVPATVEYSASISKGGGESLVVAETTQHFITAMDALKLGMVAIDQVQPLLDSLLSALNRVQVLGPEAEVKVTVRQWLSIMRQMRAVDELSKDQERQLLMDLENGYSVFCRALGGSG
mmetsp:Transcript_17960/g.60155  ORF Transcript_17960/g.60155 Transcript_17960/m.60155 type:complete len:200 (-) Transcript_17960:275-874(-)